MAPNETPPGQAVAGEPVLPPRVVDKGVEFPPWVLNTGFMLGLVLASLCLVAGAYYLIRFQSVTQGSVLKVLDGKPNEAGLYKIALAAQLYLARVQLVSCAMFIAMAFGFLGFALFLLGAKGQIDAEGSGTALKLKVLNLAPGAFILLCASILVGVCVTRPLPFGYNGPRPAAAAQAAQAAVDLPDDPLDAPPEAEPENAAPVKTDSTVAETDSTQQKGL